MPNQFVRSTAYAFALFAGLAGAAVAQAGDAGEQALQPVLDDDCCVTPGAPDDVALEPVTDEVSEIVPGDPTDDVLEPVLDDDVAPNLPDTLNLSSNGTGNPPSTQNAAKAPEKPGTTFVIYVPLRSDGSRPDVALGRAKNGKDSEILVDGAARAVLKSRTDLTLADLKIVYP